MHICTSILLFLITCYIHFTVNKLKYSAVVAAGCCCCCLKLSYNKISLKRIKRVKTKIKDKKNLYQGGRFQITDADLEVIAATGRNLSDDFNSTDHRNR